MSKKSHTIGNDPLSAYLGSKKEAPEKKEKSESASKKKQRVTIHLPVELINEVKNAVYWEPGLTLTDFAEKALESALKKLEKKRGEKYPSRNNAKLKGGRPLS